MRPTSQCPRVAPTSWSTSWTARAWAAARDARDPGHTRRGRSRDRGRAPQRRRKTPERQRHWTPRRVPWPPRPFSRRSWPPLAGARPRDAGPTRVAPDAAAPAAHAGHPLEEFVDLLAQRGAREPETAAHERQQAQGHERKRPAVGEAGMPADKMTHVVEEDRQQHAGKDEQQDRDAVPHQQQQQESRRHHGDGRKDTFHGRLVSCALRCLVEILHRVTLPGKKSNLAVPCPRLALWATSGSQCRNACGTCPRCRPASA